MRDLSAYANHPFRFIRSVIGGYFWSHVAIGLAVLGAVTCSVSTQYGLKHLVDSLSDPARHAGVWLAFFLLVSLIAADNLFWRIAAWLCHSTYVGVSGSVRRKLFRHLTGHAPSFFASQAPGALTSRITATSNALYMTETMVTFNVLPPLIATVVAIIYLATVSVGMAASLTAAVAVVVCIIFYWAARGTPHHHAYARAAASVDGDMIDVVSNISIVKSFGRLRSEHCRLGSVIGQEMRARKTSLYFLEKLRIFHAASTALLMCGVLAWAISLWQSGRATPGDVVLVSTLGLSILCATRDLAVALVDVTQHLARFSEALRTLLVRHTLIAPTVGVGPAHSRGVVEFRDVHFGYPDGGDVFSGLNFRVEAGSRVGIVGPSGAGKSTIFSLMQRFYDKQGGAILINGQENAAMPDAALRRAIAVVPQDVSLFHRSLRENIRYGRPDATDAEVWDAARTARCFDFIERLPEGLDTIVGDRGAKLSGGQRQRIAIARAFLKDAPILLLDEATSALDAESEEMIREALSTLMTGRTVLAIAHRLSTLRSFDRIMVIQDGEVVQDGRPDALLRRGGAYKSLVDLEVRRLHCVAA
ncbi:ABC transporter [Hyphomicrobium methylovorum]|uniref:ABC transporter ATP-binding protein n=1 Tax=Hyphomicrobium methylovorum TaxID=84 RepID=UPI0015E6723A|nr:ABC transporter ATP-binding protein [Hyphomicrobium methylovorum]MBA2124874.1 ABC transporter [Hyphomicrobium methylovorum]